METTCQRCNQTLGEEDRYCSVCGLPQLTYVPGDNVLPSVRSGETAENGQSLAGPGVGVPFESATGIAWKPAIRAAVVFAVPAGVLCSRLTPIGESLALVWMIGGAAWAVNLYARRARPGRISTGAGARIGLITGLLASWLTIGVNGVSEWFERFVLHRGPQMDAVMLAQLEAGVELDRQMVDKIGLSSAQAAQMVQDYRERMISPEGRAGFALFGFLFAAIFLIFFATVGGAVGARLRTQPRTRG